MSKQLTATQKRIEALRQMESDQQAALELARQEVTARESVLRATRRELMELERAESQAARWKQLSKPTKSGLLLMYMMYAHGNALNRVGFYKPRYELFVNGGYKWETQNQEMVQRLIAGGFIARMDWVAQEYHDDYLHLGLTEAGIKAAEQYANS